MGSLPGKFNILINCYSALFAGALAVLAIILAFTFYMAVVKGLAYRAVLLETLAVFDASSAQLESASLPAG
jgi:hypothetical protein